MPTQIIECYGSRQLDRQQCRKFTDNRDFLYQYQATDQASIPYIQTAVEVAVATQWKRREFALFAKGPQSSRR